MSRRGSTAAHVNLAKPYRISHENVSGGKHIEGIFLDAFIFSIGTNGCAQIMTYIGAKRKLRWRFGWSDSELEHEVDFNHTITSGKKVILTWLDVSEQNIMYDMTNRKSLRMVEK